METGGSAVDRTRREQNCETEILWPSQTVRLYYSNEKMKDMYPDVLAVLTECVHDARRLVRMNDVCL